MGFFYLCHAELIRFDYKQFILPLCPFFLCKTIVRQKVQKRKAVLIQKNIKSQGISLFLSTVTLPHSLNYCLYFIALSNSLVKWKNLKGIGVLNLIDAAIIPHQLWLLGEVMHFWEYPFSHVDISSIRLEEKITNLESENQVLRQQAVSMASNRFLSGRQRSMIQVYMVMNTYY